MNKRLLFIFREIKTFFEPNQQPKRKMKTKPIVKKKVSKVMKEFGEGKLHSGSKKGPVVSNPKQAVAIGYSEARKAMKQRKK